VRTSIRHHKSHNLILTSITGASILLKSQLRTELPPIETIEAQLDADDGDDDGNLSGASWKDRLSELADYRRVYGHCNVPRRYSENSKLATWVAYQMKHYK
jgi:hypothetical protein